MEDRDKPKPVPDRPGNANWFYSLMPRELNGLVPHGAPGPSVDLLETDTELILHANLPGINREDLDITVNRNMIILKGLAKQDPAREEKKYHLTERLTGRFYRTIPLPAEVNSRRAVAKYQNGILEVKIPKAEIAAKAEITAKKAYKPRIEFGDGH